MATSIRPALRPQPQGRTAEPASNKQPSQSTARTADKGWGADWANIPQLRGEKLRNGHTWCGPAVGTTLARMLGTHKDMRNHELLHQLVGKHTTREGTTPLEMARMVQGVGGKVDGQMLAGRYGDNEVDAILQQDNKIVAQLGMRDEKSGKTASHWVIIHGKNADGSFAVKDPLKGEYNLRPEQLREAMDRAPGLGGVMIPVAPATSRAPSAPMSEDQFVDQFRPSGGTAGARSANIPAGASAQQLAGRVEDMLSSGTLQQRREGQKQLEALERSASSVAQKAFGLVMRLFGKRPGGGQKVNYGGYGEN